MHWQIRILRWLKTVLQLGAILQTWNYTVLNGYALFIDRVYAGTPGLRHKLRLHCSQCCIATNLPRFLPSVLKPKSVSPYFFNAKSFYYTQKNQQGKQEKNWIWTTGTGSHIWIKNWNRNRLGNARSAKNIKFTSLPISDFTSEKIKELHSNQVKHTLRDCINALIIWILHSLTLASIERFQNDHMNSGESRGRMIGEGRDEP